MFLRLWRLQLRLVLWRKGDSVRIIMYQSIHGDNAWVGHDEVSTSPDNTKVLDSHEIKILEKSMASGNW